MPTKMKFHFRTKTKKAENDQIAHFRRRKRKRISVWLVWWLDLSDPYPSDFTTDLRHCMQGHERSLLCSPKLQKASVWCWNNFWGSTKPRSPAVFIYLFIYLFIIKSYTEYNTNSKQKKLFLLVCCLLFRRFISHRCDHGKSHFTLYSSDIPRDFPIHGKPATAIETVILTVC